MINDPAWQKVFASTVIENDQRLSRSLLWRMQSAYYQQSGITAWNRGAVPSYITNNPSMAAAYARVALGFLRDRLHLIDPGQPVYLLELGAGSGRFAYHFLQRFLPAVQDAHLGELKFVYVLSDFAQSNVDFWQRHPRFQPYVQSGSLELACFDPLHEDSIRLSASGRTLTADDFTNPAVIMANYFFDSLPADLFSIHGGLLCEERVTLSSHHPQAAPGDLSIMPSLEIAFRPRLTSPQYYLDADLDRLLQSYLSLLDGAPLLFPLGALECMRTLQHLTHGCMLLLAADKGEHRLEFLRSADAASAQSEISLHGSGISMRVNFHVLEAYFAQQGGQALLCKQREEGLLIGAFLADASPNGDRETRRAFAEAIESGGPDDFFQLKKALEPHYANATIEQLLAFLRLSGYDAQVFRDMFSTLLAGVDSADFFQQEHLYDAALHVRQMYYPIGEPYDLPLALAQLFAALARYPEALVCLRESQHWYGPSAEREQLLARCQQVAWEEG